MRTKFFLFILVYLACSGCVEQPTGMARDAQDMANGTSVGSTLTVSHGHAILAPSAAINRGELFRQAINQEILNFTTDGEAVVLPFLEPETAYRLDLYYSEPLRNQIVWDGEFVERIDFTTPATPRKYVPLEQAQVSPGRVFYKSDSSSCTFGFLLRDSWNLTTYAVTAGHCVDQGRDEVFDRDGSLLGVSIGSMLANNTDWGVIRMQDSVTVNPGVLGLSGPNRTAHGIESGTLLCLRGESALALVAPQRCGLAIQQLSKMFRMAAPVYQGDSGGPIVDLNGTALGIVQGYGLGVQLSSILVDAKEVLGLELRLLEATG